MKYILFTLLIILSMSMGYLRRDRTPPIEVKPIPPVVVGKDYLYVPRCTNCTEAQWKFIQEAVVKTNETIASSCFSAFMLERKLIQTLGRTNEEVVKSLVGAGVNVETEMYYSLRRVLGYTYPDQLKIWINRRYMMSWNRCDLASLLGHESAHKVGYDHDFNPTPQRPFSVPYSINDAFAKCCVR